MNAGQQFCLKWNNFSDNLLTSVWDIQTRQDLTDVTLVLQDGHVLRAHRLILSACSTYFRKLFKDTTLFLPSHPSMLVVLKDINLDEMRSLLTFMYNGEVMVEQDELSNLLKTADSLQIQGLSDQVQQNKENKPQPKRPSSPLIHRSPCRSKTNSPSLSNGSTTPPPKRPRTQEKAHLEPRLLPHEEFFRSQLIKDEPDDEDDEEEDDEKDWMIKSAGHPTGFPTSPFLSAAVKLKMAAEQAMNNASSDGVPHDIGSDGSEYGPDGGSPSRKLAFHEPRPCPVCHRMYRDAATLRTHTAIMHAEGKEPFRCSCGNIFKTKFEMYQHKRRGHPTTATV